jgi:hypothetical protein
VTWSGGSVPSDEDAIFQFLASADSAKTYSFKVLQTYSDGSVVDWSGPESSDAPAPQVELKSSFGGGGSSTGLASLFPNTTYQFQVSSKCSGITSAYSTSITFTTLNIPVACIVPYGLSTTSITNSSANVNWTNQVSADTFRVRYSVNGTANFNWKDVNGAGGATTALLAGLAASTTYQWQLRTICSGQAGPYSSSVLFTTLSQRMAAVTENGWIHDVLVYPNPAHSAATLEFNADKSTAGKVRLYDLAGREVLSGSFAIAEGKNGIELNLATLPQGVYLVVVSSGDHPVARVNLVVQ